MATRVTRRQTSLRGRVIAAIAIVSAIGLGVAMLHDLRQRPRTHAAYLFAYSAGIAPEVSGRIVTLLVGNNQRVTKGQPLVEIDREPFEYRSRQAQAQAAALRAQIRVTGRQVSSQKHGAEAAASQTTRAGADLLLAQDTLHRLEPLLAKGYVTKQQVDEARTNLRNAETAVLATTQQALQARDAVGDTATLVAQLAAAEAVEALADRDVRLSTLRAPFSGTVVGLRIAEGAYAITGQPLFTLIKDDEWFAIGDFRETDLPGIVPGAPATVWVMGADDRPVQGVVEAVGRGVQPDDGTGPGLPAVGRNLDWVVVAQRFPVWIRLRSPPPALTRIGATASVRVDHDVVARE